MRQAAAHAGCTCDAADPSVNGTYRMALCLAYIAMPLAALLSYTHPTHSMPKLRGLSALQICSFAVVLLGATNLPPIRCSPFARGALVVAIVTMRASDTYVTAMLFRVVASRAPPSKRERASLSFGQLLVLTTLLASLLAVVLVRGRAIHCQMPPPPPSVSTVLPPNCE